MAMKGLAGEIQARRAIEDRGFVVHDANIIFGMNCHNIDLVVYGQSSACYVQVKASSKPAGADCVVIGGRWTHKQLYEGAPLFNQYAGLHCRLVVIVDTLKAGETEFYVAPPAELEQLLRSRAISWARHPKRDGTPRSIGFFKELPRPLLEQWRQAWHLLGDPLG
jgi:hypothetical protein